MDGIKWIFILYLLIVFLNKFGPWFFEDAAAGGCLDHLWHHKDTEIM
jgi:hypothetical protein